MLQLSDSHFILQNSKYSLFSWFGLLIGQVEMPSAGLQQPPAGLRKLVVSTTLEKYFLTIPHP